MHLHSDPIMCLETQSQQSLFSLQAFIESKKIETHIESGLLGAEDKAMKKSYYIFEVQKFRRKKINKCKNKDIVQLNGLWFKVNHCSKGNYNTWPSVSFGGDSRDLKEIMGMMAAVASGKGIGQRTKCKGPEVKSQGDGCAVEQSFLHYEYVLCSLVNKKLTGQSAAQEAIYARRQIKPRSMWQYID